MKITATGKSVEIAIQNGLLECGLTRDEVEVKVLEEGGLFKKAKVQLSWGEDVETQAEPEVNEEIEQTTETVEANGTEEVKEEKVDTVKEKKVRVVDGTALQKRCEEFLTGLVGFIDKEAKVTCVAGENELSFTITGTEKGLSRLIGYHGENLKALQMLLSGLKRKAENVIRIYLDVNGYKADRQTALIALANKTADQAVNIERNIHLDPMNAYERRIIHTTLQERDDVTTESTGEGEKRHVVVKPVFKK